MDYETLTDADKLAIARDKLRGLESDHYRLELEGNYGSTPQVKQQKEEQMEVVKAAIAELEPVVESGGYVEMTVEELKELLKERDLPTSGTKDELIERLNDGS